MSEKTLESEGSLWIYDIHTSCVIASYEGDAPHVLMSVVAPQLSGALRALLDYHTKRIGSEIEVIGDAYLALKSYEEIKSSRGINTGIGDKTK